MSEIVSLRRAGGVPPVVVSEREVRKLAERYALRIAQIRGLIAVHGADAARLAAAARRLKERH
jgi:hypothetical protein